MCSQYVLTVSFNHFCTEFSKNLRPRRKPLSLELAVTTVVLEYLPLKIPWLSRTFFNFNAVKKVKFARSLFKCRFRAIFFTLSLNKNRVSFHCKTKQRHSQWSKDSMATEIKNKWAFHTTPECPLWTELLKLYVLPAATEDLFVRSCHVNIVNCRDLVFRESSNLMSVSRLISTVVIDVPIAFVFGDA